jgi:opacity protein-like surface antigen
MYRGAVKEKNMRKIPVLVGMLSLLTLGAYAQVTYVGMTFNLSFPTGDAKSFVDENSYLGFAFEVRRVIRTGISAGFSLSWTAFESVAATEGLDIEETRNLTTVPIMVTTHAYYNSDRFIPYVGVGAGTIYSRASTRTDQRDLDVARWHLGFMPEAGCIVRFHENAGLLLNVRYYYGLEAKDFKVSYWVLGIGLIWTGG